MFVSATDFALQLTGVIQVNKIEISWRAGFQIKLEDSAGIVGVGECAPLPGLHLESLEECKVHWTRIREQLKDKEPKYEEFDLEKPYFGMLKIQDDLYPSLSFALEQALLVLYLQKDFSAFQSHFNIKSEVF